MVSSELAFFSCRLLSREVDVRMAWFSGLGGCHEDFMLGRSAGGEEDGGSSG
jgi:hypothetical protein